MGSPGSEATRGDVRTRALEILYQRAQMLLLPLDDGAKAQQGPAGTPPPNPREVKYRRVTMERASGPRVSLH